MAAVAMVSFAWRSARCTALPASSHVAVAKRFPGAGLAALPPAGSRPLTSSAPLLRSMSCWGTSRPGSTSVPLLPPGHDYRERHHCGPPAYIGKTPVQIVMAFKDTATFPWYRLPEALRLRRFEELYQLAHRTRNRVALEAVRLLMDPAFDRKSVVQR
eukprot:gnl/TRDRNA2_/TRDRNA2_192777_c0_seq1.p1 gnl/TRDRNA2_/TRDRNA2_192777_c0~~gnl/TRDRNA2_/TRDRNA2_192777_c0_seq1.p1  ORF type:complete len:170 (+),score=18.41 gnl/TRDRNA2_/TRDRNA2_192777_c0_seq1:38-511(+)